MNSMEGVVLKLCVKYLRRHPHEVDLPASALVDLLALNMMEQDEIEGM